MWLAVMATLHSTSSQQESGSVPQTGVQCPLRDVRVIGAPNPVLGVMTGYVEVLCAERWVPVCDCDGWGESEAMVVCRQEGLSEGEHVRQYLTLH